MYELFVRDSRNGMLDACRWALIHDAAPVAVHYADPGDLFASGPPEGVLDADCLFPEPGKSHEIPSTGEFLDRLNPRMHEALAHASRSGRRIVAEACGYALRVKLWGNRAADDWGASDSRAVLEAERAVLREIHRFYGILRFRREGGTLVARFAPDHDIVDLLLPYFGNRFSGESFRIVDEKRGTETGMGREPFALNRAFLAEKAEEYGNRESEDLWRAFFRAHENPERRNPVCQDNHLPRRYRTYLPEFGK